MLSDKAVLKFLNDTKYSEPDWHFTATFNTKARTAGHAERNGEHGYHLDIKNSTYLTAYKLVDNFVHAIYIVYKIRDYSKTGVSTTTSSIVGRSWNSAPCVF